MTGLDRRHFLASSLFLLLAPRPSAATPAALQSAVLAFTGGAKVAPGRIRLDVPPLVDNGNSAPLKVEVDSPMTAADHVVRLKIFNQKNPQPDVITCHFGPRSGRALVSTRIKLADSQTLVAIAEMSDGSFWSTSADVIVTIAACIEGVQ